MRAEHSRGVRDGLLEWEFLLRGDTAAAHGLCWRVDWLRFASAEDVVVYGWLARPSDHLASGAGLLWLPGYSYGTPKPDETNLVPGVATLCINVHGNLPDTAYVNPAGKNDYVALGIEAPQDWIYRRIALHCLNAVDVLAQQDGIDGEKVAVGGMSQGGALALITAANHPLPKLCFADMPFFCSVPLAMEVSHSGAYKEIRRLMEEKPGDADEIMQTISLIDPIRHAPSVKIPTSLTAGGRDPASRAVTIAPVFPALATKLKEYRLFPEAGHVFLPEMVRTYSGWINRLLLD